MVLVRSTGVLYPGLRGILFREGTLTSVLAESNQK